MADHCVLVRKCYFKPAANYQFSMEQILSFWGCITFLTTLFHCKENMVSKDFEDNPDKQVRIRKKVIFVPLKLLNKIFK